MAGALLARRATCRGDRSWVYWRLAVMALGIAVAFVGAAGPLWIMNAS